MTDQNNYAPQGQQPQPQQYAQPQPQQYAQQQPQYAQQQPQYAQPQYVQQGAPAKSATTLIVLSVLEFLFLGGLLAIIPFVFALQANSAYKIGNVVEGDAKAKTAKTAKTALIVIAVVGVLVYVGLFALGGAAALYA